MTLCLAASARPQREAVTQLAAFSNRYPLVTGSRQATTLTKLPTIHDFSLPTDQSAVTIRGAT